MRVGSAARECLEVSCEQGKIAVLGIRVGSHFAWTPHVPLMADEFATVLGPCRVLTHLPTGFSLNQEVATMKAAKELAKRWALLQCDWSSTDWVRIVDALKAKYKTEDLDRLKNWNGKSAKKAKPLLVDWLLAKPEWRGATVGEREEDVEFTEYTRTGSRVVKAPRVTLRHPSGAVARVRADAVAP